MKHLKILFAVFGSGLLLLLLLTAGLSYAQGPLDPTFTYQGQLAQAGEPVNATCDFQFSLYDAATAGNRVGVSQSQSITVTDGLFTALLNNSNQFGPDAFNGDPRWLEISVQCPGETAFTGLGRQPLTAAPYAHYAAQAGGVAWSDVISRPANLAVITQTISGLSCSDGQLAKWNSAAGQWACAADDGGLSYTAGAGIVITGGVISSTVPHPANVIWVAESGGDFTSIQAAIDSIGDATADNRYLVRVAPGVYTEQVTMKPYVDIEGSGELNTRITFGGNANYTGTVVGANHAELRSLTVENTGGAHYAIAIYNYTVSPQLSHITAIVSGGSSNYSVVNSTGAAPTMNNVTATASGSGDNNRGVYNYASSPTMDNVTATASGGSDNRGVYNESSSPTIRNSALSGSTNSLAGSGAKVAVSMLDGPVDNGNTCTDTRNGDGDPLDSDCLPGTTDQTLVAAADGTVSWQTVPNPANVIWVAKSGGDFSSIQTAMDSIGDAAADNRYLVMVAPGVYTEQVTMKPYVDIEGSGELNTRITSGGNANATTGTVVGADNAELRFLAVENTGDAAYAVAIYNNAAPQLSHVIATASGGSTSSIGVYNNASAPMMNNVAATATGPAQTIGVYNASASPTMDNVTASGSGGSDNYGVYNASSSPTMDNVTASGSGGSDNYGVYNASSSPTIRNSALSGSTNSLAGSGAKVAVSMLDGPVDGGNACTDTRNGDGDPLDSACLPGATDQTLVAAADGTVSWQAVAAPLANVVWVAKSGGDFNSIQAALDSISDAAADNRYLVRVAPGVYTEQVTMKQYVDIEGSGELNTRITFTGSDSYTGTVVGANHAELRFLTVENTGGADYAIAIYNYTVSPQLSHVTAIVSGGNENYGVVNSSGAAPTMTHVTAFASGGTNCYSVYNYASSPTMDNVTTTASDGSSRNYGVFNESSSPTMNNVTASVSGGSRNYGVYNYNSSSPTMNHVTAYASGGTDNSGVHNAASSPTMNNVTATGSGGISDNSGVYNDASSPIMENVTATGSGESNGAESYGVYNYDSSPTMDNVTASASGGIYDNYGVYNDASSPTMNNVIATGSGGYRSCGVNNYSSLLTMNNVTAAGSGGAYNYGVRNVGNGDSYTVRINNSQISGSSNTIYNDNGFTVQIGASMMDGGDVYAGSGGTITCAGVYDENYTFYPANCP